MKGEQFFHITASPAAPAILPLTTIYGSLKLLKLYLNVFSCKLNYFLTQCSV